MSDISPLEYVQDLYNGHSAIAERISPAYIQNIHIKTRLDALLRQWAHDRKDIIITGNPGDGKTHLINVLHAQGVFEHCYVERDASQLDTSDTLAKWSEKKHSAIPFILAVNHAPLRHLASTKSTNAFPDLAYLNSVPGIISDQVVYNEPAVTLIPNTVVIDLSQRELMTNDIIQLLMQRLCALTTAQPCADCPPRRCPVEYNATMLSQPQVIDNLVKLLRIVARRGFHATMRDLIGLLAYILVGEVPCARRWLPISDNEGHIITPKPEDYAYYTLLFRGRSKLFDAIRAAFDPGNASDPYTDMPLWSGKIQEDEWLTSGSVKQPATLAELRTLKRRYYFEHRHDTDEFLQRVLPVTTNRFLMLLTNTEDDRASVEDLLAMINGFYAPIQYLDKQREFRYQLHLWNSHRYAAGIAPGYVAMRFLSADKFTIYRPQLTPSLDNAIDIHQDHVLLGTRSWQPGDPSLRVDWPMYQSLAAAQDGRPIDIQPFYILRRLDLFLRHLGQDAGGSREIETIFMSDQRRRQIESVQVNRRTRKYE